MDLRVYYQKLRKIEAAIAEPFVVLVSRETPDGGKSGMKTDVPRDLAARMIAEERADLASPEETARFREEVEQTWKAAQPAAEPTAEESKSAGPTTKAGKKS